MFGCGCFYWNRISEWCQYQQVEADPPKPFSLPSPLPQWPQGMSFGTGRICLGELEVSMITKFEKVWGCKHARGRDKGISFYRPAEIPKGFFLLGHYCQPNNRPLRGFILVARELNTSKSESGNDRNIVFNGPALMRPVGYSVVWSEHGHIWLPTPPTGYKATGFVVTSDSEEPSVEEVRCVRSDLTEPYELEEMIFSSGSGNGGFQVWTTQPCNRGMYARGVSVGTFFCCKDTGCNDFANIAGLKNRDPTLPGMPNLDQVHALIKHYGPTIYFHPDEIYLPSSVQWFFNNGAVLCRDKDSKGEPIDCEGLCLPGGGSNDGECWIDLPSDDEKRDNIKRGNLESAELYVHVKPALGGTFTDVAMWIFCPFNGPATLKVGLVSIALNKIGEHVGDWEHFTLRVNNFTGELWGVYFSEHSGGGWADASDLEFIQDNKAVVYSSRNGHASFPHAGTYLQGPANLGIGLRNDTEKSNYSIDSSIKYQLVAAEYLGEGVIQEPSWLQYMREWGPTIVYDGTAEIEKLISLLPIFFRLTVENIIFDLFPTELYGEEGPTGPKEKDNWYGDERC
uniref:Vacuolar protein sorting-associated protein 62 n=1 Tax=Kalanchoe fedtschenkoi TaxID=63787 RepID=A0A7N0TFB7_KALFE